MNNLYCSSHHNSCSNVIVIDIVSPNTPIVPSVMIVQLCSYVASVAAFLKSFYILYYYYFILKNSEKSSYISYTATFYQIGGQQLIDSKQ